RDGAHPRQRRRRSYRAPQRGLRAGGSRPPAGRERAGADLQRGGDRRPRARHGVSRADVAQRRTPGTVHARGHRVGRRAVVSSARHSVRDGAGRSAVVADVAGADEITFRAGIDPRRGRASLPNARRQVIASADVVVVGSGAFGASTAYHLARRGLRVAVLERAALASQTSPRAAGLTSQGRATPALTRLAQRAVAKLAAFTEETGQPLRFTQSGALKIARTDGDAEQLAREVDRGVDVGVPIELISVGEARRRLPILGERGIIAVTW